MDGDDDVDNVDDDVDGDDDDGDDDDVDGDDHEPASRDHQEPQWLCFPKAQAPWPIDHGDLLPLIKAS